MLDYMKAFFISLLVFLAIDAPWIYWCVLPLYRHQLGAQALAFRPLPALIFYTIFLSGLVFFVYQHKRYDSLFNAAWLGFVYGTVTYATYALTSYAVFAMYTALLAFTDILWGGVLCMIVSTVHWALLGHSQK